MPRQQKISLLIVRNQSGGWAEKGLWAATFGTGFLTAFLSSIMNNMPTVLIGALSIDGSAASGVMILLPHRYHHDPASAVCHSGRAGVASLFHIVMR